MKQTIYVDVLVVINIYINYGLLLLTSFSIRKTPERLKILLASLLGGVYSLVILIPDISNFSVAASRIPALFLMIIIAFGFGTVKMFLKTAFAFFGINLVFAGAMFMLWFLVCPENMYYNSGVVYFGIDALTLVVFTVCAYGVIRLVSVFSSKRAAENFIYSVALYVSGKEFLCKGLYDSGNCLCDPFSGEGVTVVSINVFDGFIGDAVFDSLENASGEVNMKLIPVSSVAGTKLLPSFRADKLIIRSLEVNVTVDKPVIAVCKEKIHGGEYGALLYSSVFDNITKKKGESYVLST